MYKQLINAINDGPATFRKPVCVSNRLQFMSFQQKKDFMSEFTFFAISKMQSKRSKI